MASSVAYFFLDMVPVCNLVCILVGVVIPRVLLTLEEPLDLLCTKEYGNIGSTTWSWDGSWTWSKGDVSMSWERVWPKEVCYAVVLWLLIVEFLLLPRDEELLSNSFTEWVDLVPELVWVSTFTVWLEIRIGITTVDGAIELGIDYLIVASHCLWRNGNTVSSKITCLDIIHFLVLIL